MSDSYCDERESPCERRPLRRLESLSEQWLLRVRAAKMANTTMTMPRDPMWRARVAEREKDAERTKARVSLVAGERRVYRWRGEECVSQEMACVAK